MTHAHGSTGHPDVGGVVMALKSTAPGSTALGSTALSSTQIADLLDILATANHALAAELDAIAGSRRSLSQATVARLEHLVNQMRPAAQIRQVLARLDPGELLAGAREWHSRRPALLGGVDE
ncbi:MAG: hypothetical protein ABJD68_15250 [Nakamurella sp.]